LFVHNFLNSYRADFRLSRPFLIIATALLVVLLFAGRSEGTPVKGPHSTLELALLRNGGDCPGLWAATSPPRDVALAARCSNE
jgi:hypothetical protein